MTEPSGTQTFLAVLEGDDYEKWSKDDLISTLKMFKRGRDAANAQIEALKSAQAGDARDAARYRWLRTELWETLKIPEIVHVAIFKRQGGKHEDIDAAIDAAMQAEKEKPHD